MLDIQFSSCSTVPNRMELDSGILDEKCDGIGRGIRLINSAMLEYQFALCSKKKSFL